MEKIKSFFSSSEGKNTLMAIIIVLVGFGSFSLGRLSTQKSSERLKITYPALPIQNTESLVLNSQNEPNQAPTTLKATNTKTQTSLNTNSNIDKNFIASNRGSKYYPARCSAGKNIKLENRIYFKTEQEAINAGYTKSTSCK